MTKYIDQTVRADGLNELKTCVRMSMCSAYPASYAAIAGLSLGNVSMSASDYVNSATGVNGLTTTVASKIMEMDASDAGATLHMVHDNGATIKAVTEVNAIAIIAGNEITIPAQTITFNTVTP